MGRKLTGHAVRVWTAWLDLSRRAGRDEEGGVTDEAAMIAVMLAAAVLISGIVFGLIQAASSDLEIVIPGG